MGWSQRRNIELAQRGRERVPGAGRSKLNDEHGCSICPPGREQHQDYYSELARRQQVQYDYRTPDGTLFTCIDDNLCACQARRNAWLVARVAAAQRERAKAEAEAEAEDAAAEAADQQRIAGLKARAEADDHNAMIDADLYRDSRGGYS